VSVASGYGIASRVSDWLANYSGK